MCLYHSCSQRPLLAYVYFYPMMEICVECGYITDQSVTTINLIFCLVKLQVGFMSFNKYNLLDKFLNKIFSGKIFYIDNICPEFMFLYHSCSQWPLLAYVYFYTIRICVGCGYISDQSVRTINLIFCLVKLQVGSMSFNKYKLLDISNKLT